MSSPTLRNVLPGMSDLQNLSKTTGLANGIYEQDESIYSLREKTEENKLFSINESIRTLLKDLEQNTALITEQKNEDKAQ